MKEKEIDRVKRKTQEPSIIKLWEIPCDDPEFLTFSCGKQNIKFFVNLITHFKQIFKKVPLMGQGLLGICFYVKKVVMMDNNNLNLTNMLKFLSTKWKS